MADFKKIDNARKILGLENAASLEEIKKAYRSLAHKYHPDKCAEPDKKTCEERFKRVKEAYDTLLGYCAGYRFPFNEEAVNRTTPDAKYREHMERFYDGWWGDIDT